MMRVLIYRTDTYVSSMREKALRVLAKQQDVSILGDTTAVDGIVEQDYDMVLVCAGQGDFAKVHSKLRMAGIPEERLLLDRAVCVPGFTLEKYTKLHMNPPSIIAMNCWGGVSVSPLRTPVP